MIDSINSREFLSNDATNIDTISWEVVPPELWSDGFVSRGSAAITLSDSEGSTVIYINTGDSEQGRLIIGRMMTSLVGFKEAYENASSEYRRMTEDTK